MRQLITSLMCFGVVGCAGPTPKQQPADADVDGPAGDQGQRVTGKVNDYYANTAISGASLASEGVDPPMTAMTEPSGAFTLDHVPSGGKLYLVASSTDFRPTRNPVLTIADKAMMQDQFAVKVLDAQRQYTIAAKPLVAGKAILIAELVRNNGTPIEGIPLTNIQLLDAAQAPVPGITILFVGANGDVDPALTTATAFAGRSRAVILDAPPGSFTLSVNPGAGGGGGGQPQLVPLMFSADGATLAVTNQAQGITPPLTPKFAMDVYPRLQRTSLGGLGCTSCHTTGGLGAIIKYDDPAATVLANLKAATGVIDLATPANSLFLTKPLYEPPPYNHPNAQFLDVNDPDYKMFLLWIQQGALL